MGGTRRGVAFSGDYPDHFADGTVIETPLLHAGVGRYTAIRLQMCDFLAIPPACPGGASFARRPLFFATTLAAGRPPMVVDLSELLYGPGPLLFEGAEDIEAGLLYPCLMALRKFSQLKGHRPARVFLIEAACA